MKRFSSVMVCVAAVLMLGASVGSAAASEATVTGEKKESDRLIELGIETSAFTEPTKVHVFLPTGYDSDPARRWPVTFALAGMQNNYNSFANILNGEELTSEYPSIVVSPDGNSGFWSDWFNAGAGGPPMYETYVIDQLVDLIDDRYRTFGDRSHRAIMGISMGGYGAMMMAARHPDLFAYAATISGAVDSNNPLIGGTMTFAPTFDGGAMDAIYGPRLTEEVRWHGHNPTDLASNLRGIDLQVRTANGVLNPEIGEGDNPADSLSCVVEGGVYQGSTSFHETLSDLNVEHLWKDYGNGCHTFENFTRESVDTMEAFEANFASPDPDPARFNYRSIEPGFDIWDWQIKADPERALEFMTVEGTGSSIFLEGSGTTTVTSPAWFKGLKKVDAGSRTYRPAADGRITFKVDLGPAHTVQQYTPGASSDFESATVGLKPHAMVKITRSARTKRGVRVCARAIGGVVPKAKVKAGKRTATMKLGAKTRCRNLRTRSKPKSVSIQGRDTFGHTVRARAAIRR